MKITKAEFVKSATQPSQYPPPDLPEVAFVGRSNVGKSSLINALVGRKNLAKTSNTPGRTQLINFFSVNDKISFVDLPGYGFAKVSRAVRKNWGEMIESYLRGRPNLALVILILDIRRVPNDDDLSLCDWLEYYRIPCLYVLTKSDKLSNNEIFRQRKLIEKKLRVSEEDKMVVFSAKTATGKEQLWRVLKNMLCPSGDVVSS